MSILRRLRPRPLRRLKPFPRTRRARYWWRRSGGFHRKRDHRGRFAR